MCKIQLASDKGTHMAITLSGNVKEKDFSMHAKPLNMVAFLWGWWEVICACNPSHNKVTV